MDPSKFGCFFCFFLFVGFVFFFKSHSRRKMFFVLNGSSVFFLEPH